MLKKLLNVILLTNGVSTPDECDTSEDKWAERRRKFGDTPWDEQRPEIPGDRAASDKPATDADTPKN